MANQVSGLAGYRFRRNNGDGTYTVLNELPTLTPVVADDLSSGTDYNGVFEVQAVDNAGNPTAWVAITDGAETLSSTPDQEPMSSTKTAAIDTIVAQCMAAGCGPGVTIAVVSPDGYYTHSYGSDTGNDAHYRMASQTKTFTANAILMSVDQGLLSLDDHLEDFYPGVPNGATITIEQMLMMRSGVYDYQLYPNLGMNFVLNPSGAMTVEQIMAIIKGGAPMFAPGDGYYYTNSNYYLLAKVAEAVDPTHRSIDIIIAEDILAPLGLVNTYMQLTTGGLAAPFSPGYDHNPILSVFGIILKRNVTNQNPAYIWASGAMVSVISDMIKWGEELRDGTLLSPETQELRMTTFSEQPISPIPGLNHGGADTFGYGLGFIRVGSWFGHDGSWLGHDSVTMFEPHTGTVISVYENFQTPGLKALTLLWYEIAEYLVPYSARYTGYATGGPFTGGMGATVGPITAAMTGAKTTPASFALPATLPADFVPSAP